MTEPRAGEDGSDVTVELSEMDAKALARHLVARHLFLDDWLSWEDLPHLSGRSFAALDASVDAIVQRLHAESVAFDRAEDIDSVELLQRAQP